MTLQQRVAMADQIERQAEASMTGPQSVFDAAGHQISLAQTIAQRFSAEDSQMIKEVMSNTVTFLPADYINKIRDLFNKLDASGDGILGEEDFVSPVPAANAFLRNVWSRIISKFDFDGDGKIAFEEFAGYFVVFALYQVPMDAIPASQHMILQFSHWRNNFLTVIHEKIVRFEAEITGNAVH